MIVILKLVLHTVTSWFSLFSAAVVNEVNDPYAPIGFGWILLFPLLAALAINMGYGYDAINSVHAKYINNRSLKSSFFWIFAKKNWFSKSTLQDIKSGALNMFLVGPLALVGITYESSEETMGRVSLKLASILHLNPESLKPGGSHNLLMDVIYILAIIVGSNFGLWISHYLMHRIPFLWEFHKFHHAATSLTPFTNYRASLGHAIFFDFAAGVGMALVAIPFPLVFGYTPAGGDNIIAFTLVWLLTGPVSMFIHSPIWISLGRLEYVITSPAVHAIHHSTNPEHFNKNFGGELSIFDTLFGTLHRSEKAPPPGFSIGLPDEPVDLNEASVWEINYLPIKTNFQRIFSKNTPPDQGDQDRQEIKKAA